MTFPSFILYALLLLQFSLGSNALEIINEKILKDDHNNVVKSDEDQDGYFTLDPSLNVFFKITDLYLGNKISVFFASNDDSTSTRLRSKQDVDSIPFSLSKLPYLLKYFSFSNTSSQAKAMETTLKQCEIKAIGGEVKTCVTSIESMLEMIHHFFGMVKPKVLATKVLSSKHTLFQNYTFVEKPIEINFSKVIACHTMAYPYLVYYCHGHKEGHKNRVFKIALGGDNKERVEAIAVCHMDTSSWDRHHVSYRLLGVQPGSPVCHVLPLYNVLWFA
ncbi:hypothetical protein QVD17_14458 [Tagetes erecta]|uniref:BURP domain-containing protein n=1 Tax=Tagetes erecta TaxID=13708 RepID=A0AAD8KWW9_TARER|nr:hypothetical protein QVD17_14458 [Tagetes erecta]